MSSRKRTSRNEEIAEQLETLAKHLRGGAKKPSGEKQVGIDDSVVADEDKKIFDGVMPCRLPTYNSMPGLLVAEIIHDIEPGKYDLPSLIGAVTNPTKVRDMIRERCEKTGIDPEGPPHRTHRKDGDALIKFIKACIKSKSRSPKDVGPPVPSHWVNKDVQGSMSR